ncbi:MAG: Y-family DNA polymerase [Kangiellaceae bacterium]
MWLSIRLPQLPLQALYFEQSKLETITPQAVIESNRIICFNQTAYQQGIREGQSISSAYALCDQVHLSERNLTQEKQKLESLAIALYRFSPCIAIELKGFLVIEIAASLKLYHGLNNLLTMMQQTLNQQAVSYQLAIGHTPSSSALLSFKDFDYSLSCWCSKTQKIDKQKIIRQLKKMPVELMSLPIKTIEKIQSVGIKSIAKLDSLEKSSIRKRFGILTSEYLAHLFARTAEPKDYFKPPESFIRLVEFVDVIHHREALIFPIKRLIQDLCSFLRLKQKTCQHLYWELFDSEKNTIGFEVVLSDSQINEKIYIQLTQLSLERYSLHAPIDAISLKVEQLVDLDFTATQLFDEANDFKQDNLFMNKIKAKLGNESCFHLYQTNEQIPEMVSHQINEFSSTNYQKKSDTHLIRPSWLFEKAKPIYFDQRNLTYNGRLQILSSQERITSYWWKKKTARDYYLAEHEDGTIYWVFFDQINKGWYLHGIYS